MSKTTAQAQTLPEEIGPSPDWTKERTLLYQLVREEGTKITDIAREINKSHSTVSLYVSGKYPANEEFETLIRNYLIKVGKWQLEAVAEVAAAADSTGGNDQTPPAPPTRKWATRISDIGQVQTSDLLRVWGICRKSYENREFGMLIGNPGTGKTYALDKYHDMDSIPVRIITCDETSTVKSILIDTAEALDIQTKGTSSTLMRRIVKFLKERSRLLVYDETDLLRGPKVFETIRAIYDKSGNCGVVLCGNKNLAERLLSLAEDRPEMARLRDRIGYFQKLSGLTEEEARQFLRNVHLTPDAAELLVRIACKRGIRQLVNALRRLLEVTQGELITEDLVADLGQIVLSFNA